MSSYASPLSSGKTSPKGFLRVLGKMFTGSGVIESTALTVSAQLTPDMTVKVSGSALDDNAVLIHSDGTFIQAWNEADVSVTILANVTGVTKTDAIVAYVDLNDYDASNANNPDSFKFIAVRRGGTDTGAPTNGEISTAVASNPYIVLAHVTVANGAMSINSGNISDQRTMAQLKADQLEPLSGDQYGEDSITPAKIATVTKQMNPNHVIADGLASGSEYITFPNSVTTKVAFLFRIPSDYVSGDLTVKGLVSSSSTTGTIWLEQWSYRYRTGAAGGLTISAGTTSSLVAPPTTTNYTYYSYTIAASNFQAGDVIFFLLKRSGSHAGDTNTGTFAILSVWAEYTGRVS